MYYLLFVHDDRGAPTGDKTAYRNYHSAWVRMNSLRRRHLGWEVSVERVKDDDPRLEGALTPRRGRLSVSGCATTSAERLQEARAAYSRAREEFDARRRGT